MNFFPRASICNQPVLVTKNKTNQVPLPLLQKTLNLVACSPDSEFFIMFTDKMQKS